MGGLTPAQRSSDFHYVWQLLGLCVLEGPAGALTGASRQAASPPSLPPPVHLYPQGTEGECRSEACPCPGVCLPSPPLASPFWPQPWPPGCGHCLDIKGGSFWLSAGKPGSWQERRPLPETKHNDHLPWAGGGRGESLSLLPTPPPHPLQPISWLRWPARAEAAACGPCPVWKPRGSFCFLPSPPFPTKPPPRPSLSGLPDVLTHLGICSSSWFRAKPLLTQLGRHCSVLRGGPWARIPVSVQATDSARRVGVEGPRVQSTYWLQT